MVIDEPMKLSSIYRFIDLFQESINDPSKRWMVIAGAVMVVIIVVAIIVQIFRKPASGSQWKYD